jgi:hypothetical protein
MKTISFKSLLLSLLFAMIGGFALAASAGLPALPVAGGLFATSLFPAKAGVASMAVQKEIWINDIVGNLFKANPHLAYAMNADSFVLAGKVVHIPNAGSKPAVKRNRKNFPATVTLRQDSDVTFTLDEYTSDPIKIENADKYELSYDKRQSVIGEQSAAISELVGDWFFRYWAPTKKDMIVRTTGDAVAAHMPEATGNRKKITVADVKRMQKLFNKNNIPKEGRVACLDADMYDQLTDDMTLTQYRDFSQYLNVKDGTVGKLYGFTFLDSRSTVLNYTNAATPAPKDPGATGTATDNAAALFWHRDLVVRALGEKEFFDNEGDPTHYGDIYSALLRAGGRIKREDGKGVYALVQAAVQ